MANSSAGSWSSSTPTNITTITTAATTTATSSATTANVTISNATWSPVPTVTFPTIDESLGITFLQDGEEVYRFSTDIEAVEAMVQWIFENTTGRFYSLGTSRWYFELKEDAVAFKLVFKGHKLVDDSKIK